MKRMAILAAMAVGAPAFAANVFVKNANVSSAQQAHRDELTQMVRDSVKLSPGQSLVWSESQADVVLQPTLMGGDGSFSLRVDRLRNGEVVQSTERTAGDWREVPDISRQATMSVIAGSDEGYRNAQAQNLAPSEYPQRSAPSTNRQDRSIAAPYAAAQSRTAPTGTDSVATPPDDSTNANAPQAQTPAPPPPPAAEPAPAPTSEASTAGENRSSNPIEKLRKSPGHWIVGLGPGFGIGMNANNIMYSANGGYGWDLSQRYALKVIGEADFGSGSDNARMIDLAVGGDVILGANKFAAGGKPYVTADLGLGNARNQTNDQTNGVTAGVGAGLRYAMSDERNLDVLLHYKAMTSTIDNANPSVLGIRAAFNF